MAFLDSYDTFVSQKCEQLAKQNNTFEKLTEATGAAGIAKSIQDQLSRGVIDSLKESPLKDMAEDYVAKTVSENVRKLTQNALGQIPEKLTNTLTDIRASAFNAVFSTLTVQNDLVIYFARVVAEQAVEALREKRRTLLAMQESVRRLHNALLVLAGGGPFFQEYLERIRRALILIDQADQQLFQVRSAFFSISEFPPAQYERAKNLLDEAYELLAPLRAQNDNFIDQGFLKGVFELPSPDRQLSALMTIPRLTGEMLAQYDLYALKTTKANALILGFQSIVQNLQEVTGGDFKDLVLNRLDDVRVYLRDLVRNMALQVNGDENAIGGPVRVPFGNPVSIDGRQQRQTRSFNPNPTKTSTRAVSWAVRVKSARRMLDLVQPEALQQIGISNNALRAYSRALEGLGALNDRVTPLAILRATEAREEVGDMEPSFITFAFQANQAILDSAAELGNPEQFDPGTVLALGANVNSRIQLSIDQDREAEQILLRFIRSTDRILGSLNQLGNSVFNLLEDLGMDRAADSLRRGDIVNFFNMDGRTCTYVGAAVSSLSALRVALRTEEERQCISQAINRMQAENTSKNLAAQRKVGSNFIKQQLQNEAECEQLRGDQQRTQSCASGFDVSELRSAPFRSLFNLFKGVLGGDVSDTLQGSAGFLKTAANSSASLGDISNPIGFDTRIAQSIYDSSGYALKATQEAIDRAESVNRIAEGALSNALSRIPGYEPTEDDDLNSLKSKAEVAAVENPDNEDLFDAIVEAEVAEETTNEAQELSSNQRATRNDFDRLG